MSKSEGTGITPRELMTGEHPLLTQAYDPMTIRFFMLQAHYRSTLDFSNEALQAAEKGNKRLMQAMADLNDLPTSDSSSVDVADLRSRIVQAMDDDFNSPIAIAHMFEMVKWVNLIKDGKETITAADLKELQEFSSMFVHDVLGLKDERSASMDNNKVDGLMQMVLEIRNEAKTNRDFSTADSIRDKLAQLGFEIKDGKDGTTYTIK